MFGEGPISLMKSYYEILNQYGMGPYFFNERNPKRWYRKQWVDETEMVILLLIGNSYVIAEKCEFERI